MLYSTSINIFIGTPFTFGSCNAKHMKCYYASSLNVDP
ncbi:hypothetical protein [Tundra vole stool-associated circular virus]|nr:hypothetical protein [Tundra vole stool-associated circular virus]